MEKFYSETYTEEDRLHARPHGRLEFIRMQELLRRLLPPPPGRVLDVGGGTGVHASWLAEDGYSVHLIDPVPRHVAVARDISAGTFSVVEGDARALEEPDDSADIVLLLGPLYHLVERSDRMAALQEARRVLRPRGVVAGSAISRHAALLDFTTKGLLDSRALELIRELLERGVHDARLGFTRAHFHTPGEAAGELTEAGFDHVDVFGIEGPGWMALDASPEERVDSLMPSALECARLAEQDPALVSTSAHLLAIGRCLSAPGRCSGAHPPPDVDGGEGRRHD